MNYTTVSGWNTKNLVQEINNYSNCGSIYSTINVYSSRSFKRLLLYMINLRARSPQSDLIDTIVVDFDNNHLFLTNLFVSFEEYLHKIIITSLVIER